MINHPERTIPQKRKRGQSVWTPERRAAAAARARSHKPSRFSTGPKTASGKARACLNAWKHGLYCRAAKDLRLALHRHARFIKDINRMITAAKRSRAAPPSPPFGEALLSCTDPATKTVCFPEQDKIRSEKCQKS